ncbi:DDE-type integrase/transposase/recombinase [Burkholderia cenocepacia]|uniref:Mu transposase C-terminal domain-containing protein n=1 Tax=Burkholderia cenocepacia TaxID=95486 RepID=UPI0023BA0634|nr:DDE-type integrase/transposase/recombinase [Burkholderia cenocepacia]MDF0499979.1 DDE-type integrase/transposase/recombinase [Burkholderia cenocepacia]
MKSYIFKIGVSIVLDEQIQRIAHVTSDGLAHTVAMSNGALSVTSITELQKQYQAGRLRFLSEEPSVSDPTCPRLGRPLSTFPHPVREKALRKKKYLDMLLARGPLVSTPSVLAPLIQECAAELNDPRPPSVITVYRWAKRLLRAGGDNRALIDRFDHRGRGSRLPLPSLNLLHQSIESVYLARERASGLDVHADLRYRIDHENEYRVEGEKIPMPSLATVYRVIRSLDSYDVTTARHGKRIANITFRTSGSGVQVEQILERVEIDHTPLDLFVIDERTQLPLGRPTVTIALDRYSRMPVGMHVGFQGPSVNAVLRCLRHAIAPKADLQDRYPDLQHEWPCYGKIRELVCDNGLEFHSDELRRIAFELGMIVTFCPKRQPWFKGAVERFLKTLNYQFSHTLPGTSFARWFHREDYDPQEQALITYDQLHHVLTRWIVDVYAHSLHRGIKTTPYEKWVTGARLCPPVLPSSMEDVDIRIGETHTRTLSHYGVELNNLRYNDPALLKIRSRYGPRVKVEVISYFDDVSRIAVIDPDSKVPITIPALDQEYAYGLTREQHRLLCARARENGKGLVDQSALAKAKSEIRALISEFALSKSQRKRQKSAVWRGVGTEAADILATPSSTTTRPKLQCQVDKQRPTVPVSELPKLAGLLLSGSPNKQSTS